MNEEYALKLFNVGYNTLQNIIHKAILQREDKIFKQEGHVPDTLLDNSGNRYILMYDPKALHKCCIIKTSARNDSKMTLNTTRSKITHMCY